MKLVRIGETGKERPGVLLDGDVVADASEHVDDFDQEFFANDGLKGLAELVRNDSLPHYPVGGVRFGSPIGKPYQVLCIGHNYRDHIAEVGAEVPEEPTAFNKSCETFNPLGPWLATPDEIDDPQALNLTLSVNGDVKQLSSTASMIFSVSYLIWYLSQFMILEPGDLINTGTPAGGSLGKEEQPYLTEGDVIDLSIEQLGQQRQVVRRATR